MRTPLASLAALTLIGCHAAETEPDGGACTLTAPALPDTRLHADGTRLRDALGRVVILRGVNAGGRSKFTPFAPFDYPAGGYQAALDAYLDRAQSWGLDALRVPFTWAAVEPTKGADDEDYLARYDAILDGAYQRGMRTIVDFHQDVYAEVFCGDGFPAWTVPDPKPAPHHDCPAWSSAYFSDPDVIGAFDRFWADGSEVMKAYASLWDRLAARHRDRPGVIGFELINEPGWGSEPMDAFEAGTLTSFYSTMIPRVRQAAPDTLIFFDPPGPDAGVAQTSMGLPAGEGLVFAPHYYQLGALQGIAGTVNKVGPDLTRWSHQGATWNVPVLIGELGAANPTADLAHYLTAHYDALDALGLSSTQWEYSVAAELWNSEDLSLVRADGSETPSASAILRAYPRAVAGDDHHFTYDSTSRGFTLSYVAASGITEVATPERLYPAGYEVEVQNGCADQRTAGRLLVQASAPGAAVTVTVRAR